MQSFSNEPSWQCFSEERQYLTLPWGQTCQKRFFTYLTYCHSPDLTRASVKPHRSGRGYKKVGSSSNQFLHAKRHSTKRTACASCRSPRSLSLQGEQCHFRLRLLLPCFAFAAA